MITINVACSGKYDILIKNGLLDSAGAIISERFKGTRICVITDDNVAPIYLSRVTGAIKTAGIDCEGYVFGHGEANKTLSTIESICTFLAEKQGVQCWSISTLIHILFLETHCQDLSIIKIV